MSSSTPVVWLRQPIGQRPKIISGKQPSTAIMDKQMPGHKTLDSENEHKGMLENYF
ncbi:hypothetical protein [Radicibacter daui]|uniref:hypothetical protein n=1 Tax=Radicibacter daui TaxID=3064829 RepID=UPI0040470268